MFFSIVSYARNAQVTFAAKPQMKRYSKSGNAIVAWRVTWNFSQFNKTNIKKNKTLKLTLSRISTIVINYNNNNDLKFGEGDGPNLCRVKK